MKLTRFTIQTCCGGTSVIYTTDQPLTKIFLEFLVAHGFQEATDFTKAGILYVDNQAVVITGPFGSNRLQVKCRMNKTQKQDQQCDKKLKDFEQLVANQGNGWQNNPDQSRRSDGK